MLTCKQNIEVETKFQHHLNTKLSKHQNIQKVLNLKFLSYEKIVSKSITFFVLKNGLFLLKKKSTNFDLEKELLKKIIYKSITLFVLKNGLFLLKKTY